MSVSRLAAATDATTHALEHSQRLVPGSLRVEGEEDAGALLRCGMVSIGAIQLLGMQGRTSQPPEALASGSMKNTSRATWRSWWRRRATAAMADRGLLRTGVSAFRLCNGWKYSRPRVTTRRPGSRSKSVTWAAGALRRGRSDRSARRETSNVAASSRARAASLRATRRSK